VSQRNIEIVRSMMDEWAHGRFAAGADDLDAEVQFIVRPDFPSYVSCVGPAEVDRYMRGFLEEWTDYSIRADELRAYGDTVLVSILQRGTGRSSGAFTEQRSYMLFTFRGGRIIRIESILRESDALEAVGASR
jgi:ketosteroid isomerase-like protein